MSHSVLLCLDLTLADNTHPLHPSAHPQVLMNRSTWSSTAQNNKSPGSMKVGDGLGQDEPICL